MNLHFDKADSTKVTFIHLVKKCSKDCPQAPPDINPVENSLPFHKRDIQANEK